MSEIRYFDIAWLSKLDGPGTRLVVFFQGCNLKCKWCHSPQSWNTYSPVLLNKLNCQYCGTCEIVCKNGVHKLLENGSHILNIQNCTSCGKCVEACTVSSPHSRKGALILPTEEIEVSELFKLIFPQLKILKRSGGITLSGGEALFQYKAAKELLKLCKECGIHTCIESSGLLPLENYKHVSEFVDYWLIGIRGVDQTSPKFSQLAKTLQFLSSLNKEILVRFPVVCGYTDSKEQLETTKKLMKDFSLNRIQLLPYNKHTSHYYEAMNLPFELNEDPSPSQECLEKIGEFFQDSNIQTILDGGF